MRQLHKFDLEEVMIHFELERQRDRILPNIPGDPGDQGTLLGEERLD